MIKVDERCLTNKVREFRYAGTKIKGERCKAKGESWRVKCRTDQLIGGELSRAIYLIAAYLLNWI